MRGSAPRRVKTMQHFEHRYADRTFKHYATTVVTPGIRPLCPVSLILGRLSDIGALSAVRTHMAGQIGECTVNMMVRNPAKNNYVVQLCCNLAFPLAERLALVLALLAQPA